METIKLCSKCYEQFKKLGVIFINNKLYYLGQVEVIIVDAAKCVNNY